MTKMVKGSDYLLQAALLKGVIEHGDGTAYFGSLLGYADHKAQAIQLGWIESLNGHLFPTAKGREVYSESRLDTLPKTKFSRAYGWDWSKIQIKIEAP